MAKAKYEDQQKKFKAKMKQRYYDYAYELVKFSTQSLQLLLLHLTSPIVKLLYSFLVFLLSQP